MFYISTFRIVFLKRTWKIIVFRKLFSHGVRALCLGHASDETIERSPGNHAERRNFSRDAAYPLLTLAKGSVCFQDANQTFERKFPLGKRSRTWPETNSLFSETKPIWPGFALHNFLIGCNVVLISGRLGYRPETTFVGPMVGAGIRQSTQES